MSARNSPSSPSAVGSTTPAALTGVPSILALICRTSSRVISPASALPSLASIFRAELYARLPVGSSVLIASSFSVRAPAVIPDVSDKCRSSQTIAVSTSKHMILPLPSASIRPRKVRSQLKPSVEAPVATQCASSRSRTQRS